MLRAIVLLAAVTLMGGCVLVPAGPPVIAEPALVVPGPVIVAPRPPVYRFHRGYYGGRSWRGYGGHW
jgi:hypothetical protein